jgi:hypothetical protein
MDNLMYSSLAETKLLNGATTLFYDVEDIFLPAFILICNFSSPNNNSFSSFWSTFHVLEE